MANEIIIMHCKDCKGRGYTGGLALCGNYIEGERYTPTPCKKCKGTGHMVEQRQIRY